MAKVNIGGLYRCCVELASGTEGKNGDILICKNCGAHMAMIEGKWKWISDKK